MCTDSLQEKKRKKKEGGGLHKVFSGSTDYQLGLSLDPIFSFSYDLNQCFYVIAEKLYEC